MIMESKFLDIELFMEGRFYCAYISEDGSSGYSIKSHTADQCAEKVKRYIIDSFRNDI